MKKLIYILTALASVFAVTSCNDTLSMAELTEKMNETVENAALDTDDKDRPVLELVEAAKSETAVKNKSGLYENMTATSLEAILGSESGKKYHTKSIWIHAKGNDASTGIKYLKVHEKLLKKTDGTDVSSQNITADSKAGTDKMGKSNFAEGWFEYKFVLGYDGIVELTFTAVDFGGNESLETASFVVLKDTTLLLEDFMCFNKMLSRSFDVPFDESGNCYTGDGWTFYYTGVDSIDENGSLVMGSTYLDYSAWKIAKTSDSGLSFHNMSMFTDSVNIQSEQVEKFYNANGLDPKIEELARKIYVKFENDKWYSGSDSMTSFNNMLRVYCGDSESNVTEELSVSIPEQTSRTAIQYVHSSKTYVPVEDTFVSFNIPVKYTGDRDIFIKLIVSDEAGNTEEILRVIPKRPQIYGIRKYLDPSWGQEVNYLAVEQFDIPAGINARERGIMHQRIGNLRNNPSKDKAPYLRCNDYVRNSESNQSNSLIVNSEADAICLQRKITFGKKNETIPLEGFNKNEFDNVSLYSFPAILNIGNADSEVKAPVILSAEAVADSAPNSALHNINVKLDNSSVAENGSDVSYFAAIGFLDRVNEELGWSFFADVPELKENLTFTVPTLESDDWVAYTVVITATDGNTTVNSNSIDIYDVADNFEGHDNIPPVYDYTKGTQDSGWGYLYKMDFRNSRVRFPPDNWGSVYKEPFPDKYYFYVIPYTDEMGDNLDYFSEKDLKNYTPKCYTQSAIPFYELVEYEKYYIVEKRYDRAGNYSIKGIMFFDRSMLELNSTLPYFDIKEDGKYTCCFNADGFELQPKMSLYASFSKFDGNEWTYCYRGGDSISKKDDKNYYETNFSISNLTEGLFRKVNITGSIVNSYENDQLITSRPLYFYNPLLKCDLKNLVEGNAIMTVLCDQPALIQLVTSTRNYGANASDWVTYCGGGGILNEEVVKTTTNYRVDDSAVPSGNYYVVIVHFADGTSAISKVHQKK